MLADDFHPSACFMSPGGIVEPLVPRMVERLARLLGQVGFGAEHRVLNGFSYHVTPAGLLFHEALVEAGCSVLPPAPRTPPCRPITRRRSAPTHSSASPAT